MSEICPWLSITLHYSVCKWQWNSALRLLLPTPLCTKIVNGTQNWGHPTLMVLNSDWLSLGCLFSIIAWDMTFSLIFRFSHLLKYSGFFFSEEAVLGHLYNTNFEKYLPDIFTFIPYGENIILLRVKRGKKCLSNYTYNFCTLPIYFLSFSFRKRTQ
jgi:hypothetical protein